MKYALLRQLTLPEDISTVVCWMLTKDEGGNDGRRTGYLEDPEEWRPLAPPVFDFLRHLILERERRDVRALEESQLLPNARYYSQVLTDDPGQRRAFFDHFVKFAREATFLFFDPDNGVEVKSVKYGRKRSSKYLYWDEVKRVEQRDRSLLIYQHLPPKPRQPFVRHVAAQLLERCSSRVVLSIRSAKVAFFLVPREGMASKFREALSAMERTWEGILTVSEHQRI